VPGSADRDYEDYENNRDNRAFAHFQRGINSSVDKGALLFPSGHDAATVTLFDTERV